MTQESTNHAESLTPRVLVLHAGYESFVLSVSLIMLVNSVLLILPFADDIRSVAWAMNSLLSGFLIVDALMRFVHPSGRMRWLINRWGWLTLLGSLPAPFASVGRLLAAWLTLRHIRRADLAAVSVSIVTKRAQSTLLGVLLVAILVFDIAGILILRMESASPDANIRDASDALWWGYVTMATVGYGDRYPVTGSGRLIGVALMTIGVALFSVITSYLADWFRRPRAVKARHLPPDAPIGEVTALLAGLRQALDNKAQADQLALEELRARLDELERRLQ